MGRGSSGIGAGGGVGGSRMVQTADLDHSAALQEKLKKEEDRTRDYKREQMTVYDENGNEIIHRGGGKGAVEYTISEAQQFFYGATITHNHPAGDERGGISGTFSVADVETFRYGLKEMRASGAEGTYVLRNKNYNNRQADRSMDFYRAYADFNQNQTFGSVSDIKMAQAKAAKTKIGRQYNSEIERASRLFTRGDREAASRLYQHAEINYKTGYKHQIKRYLYENMNSTTSGWLKTNAEKYGFEYILTK